MLSRFRSRFRSRPFTYPCFPPCALARSTDVFTAALGGTLSRKSSWYAPSRRTFLVDTPAFSMGWTEKRFRTQSRRSRFLSTPYTSSRTKALSRSSKDCLASSRSESAKTPSSTFCRISRAFSRGLSIASAGLSASVRDEFKGLGDLADIDAGIEARSEGTVVQDPDDGQRIGVLDAGGQVPFTRNGNDGMGLCLRHPPSRQRAAGGHRKVDMILVGEHHQVLDLAFAAGLALVRIGGDLDGAVVELEAVGHEEQDAAGLGVPHLRPDQKVVHLDEGLLDLFLGNAQNLAHDDHDGKEDLDDDAPQPAGEKHLPAADQGQDQEPHTEDQDAQGRTHREAHDPRRPGMNVLEADIGDQVERHGDRGNEQDRENDEADEDSFFGLGHGFMQETGDRIQESAETHAKMRFFCLLTPVFYFA